MRLWGRSRGGEEGYEGYGWMGGGWMGGRKMQDGYGLSGYFFA
jgi:hypothetical protein